MHILEEIEQKCKEFIEENTYKDGTFNAAVCEGAKMVAEEILEILENYWQAEQEEVVYSVFLEKDNEKERTL